MKSAVDFVQRHSGGIVQDFPVEQLSEPSPGIRVRDVIKSNKEAVRLRMENGVVLKTHRIVVVFFESDYPDLQLHEKYKSIEGKDIGTIDIDVIKQCKGEVIAGNHRRAALQELHVDFPMTPDYASFPIIPVVVPKRDSPTCYNLSLFGGFENTVSGTRRDLSFADQVVGLHDAIFGLRPEGDWHAFPYN